MSCRACPYVTTLVKGEWASGKPHGQGTATHRDGEKYEGTYKAGLYHGEGTSLTLFCTTVLSYTFNCIDNGLVPSLNFYGVCQRLFVESFVVTMVQVSLL